MRTQRKNTQIIAERAAVFASFINCNKREIQAARTAAANSYNEGSSGANAVSQGFKTAKRWKDQGIARKHHNVINFHQRVSQMRAAGA